MIWTPENSTTLGLERAGKLVAGVWYEDYNQQSVMAHIAIDGRIDREFLFAIFDYPFRQLGVRKVVCPVVETNEASINLVQKLGFSEAARLKESHPDGDLIFYTLNRENCKYTGARYRGKRFA